MNIKILSNFLKTFFFINKYFLKFRKNTFKINNQIKTYEIIKFTLKKKLFLIQ